MRDDRRLRIALNSLPRWLSLLGRLGIVLILIALLRPAPILVTPGPPQRVVTTSPILGVHTRLNDEVEPWKVQRTLAAAREMGAPWVVEFFPWAYYEPDPDRFDWSQPDLIIDHATAQGLTVIARLGLTPAWARPPDTPLTYLDEAGYAPFAAYAAAFAARYRGRVDHIIVGNEPNLAFEWGFRQTTPDDYVALLRMVYPAIKAANPDAIVLAGALAPTLEPPGSPNGLNDLLYLEGMYAAGSAELFDALAVHAYGTTFPPESEPDPTVLNFRRVELLRDIMVRNGDEDKPVFITETGYNDHPRWTRAVRPAQRVQYTLGSLEYAATNWPWTEAFVIWLLRTPAPTNSYQDYFTLMTPDFVPKPLYDALQQATGNE